MSRWINVKTQLPRDGQEVYYFSPYLGLWRGTYNYTPNKTYIDGKPLPDKLAAIISPHVFRGGGGCCDTDDVTHWQPYNEETKKHVAQGWVPLPPNYQEPDMADLRNFHDKDEELSVQEYLAEAAASPDRVEKLPAEPQNAWLDADELVVDPSSGWRYGFPKVWDKTTHPDLTRWLIENGYPEKEANRGLPVRFMSVPHSVGENT